MNKEIIYLLFSYQDLDFLTIGDAVLSLKKTFARGSCISLGVKALSR